MISTPRLTRSRPVPSRVSIALVVVALLASACGGSESDDATTDTGTATTEDGPTVTGASEVISDSTTPSNDDPIVIGMPLALTGVISGFDLPYLNGAMLAAKQINADGGVLGRQIQIETADTKSDLALIASTAEELVASADPDFIIPTLDYDFGSPSARVAEAQDPPLISVGFAGDPRFGLEGIGPHTYNLFPAGGTESATVATYAFGQGLRLPFVLGDTSIGYSTNATDTFVAAWTALAGEDAFAGQDTFSNGDPSIAAQISRLKESSEADFVYLGSYPPGGAAAVKQIRDAGVTLPILSGNGFDGTFWLQEGQTIEDFYAVVLGVTTADADPREQRAAFYAAYLEEYGEVAPLGGQTAAGYSAVQALAIAVERAGSTDTEAVTAELNAFSDEELVLASVTWTDACHVNLGVPLPVVSFKDGEEVLVEVVEADPTAVPDAIC